MKNTPTKGKQPGNGVVFSHHNENPNQYHRYRELGEYTYIPEHFHGFISPLQFFNLSTTTAKARPVPGSRRFRATIRPRRFTAIKMSYRSCSPTTATPRRTRSVLTYGDLGGCRSTAARLVTHNHQSTTYLIRVELGLYTRSSLYGDYTRIERQPTLDVNI